MSLIRVLIADDHPVFRFGMRALLEAQADLEVVGEAVNGHEVIAKAKQLIPDVILMDINMPEINGVLAAREILATSPGISVLMMTMLEDDTVFEAMRAGARGYLLKGVEPDDIIRAIRAVANKEVIFSPGIAERILDVFSGFANPSPKTDHPKLSGHLDELTERELEVLHLIAKGLSNDTIAQQLNLSPKTVRNHITAIFSKLEITRRAEAIIRARDAGLGID